MALPDIILWERGGYTYFMRDVAGSYLLHASDGQDTFIVSNTAMFCGYQLNSEKGEADGYASLDTDGKVPASQLPQSGGGMGYAINLHALTSSPADGATVYFGTLPKAPVTVAATSKVYIPKAGTLKVAEIYCYSGTAGTAEAWSLYVRKNNTTDYLIATVSLANKERVFSNANMGIALAVGDYIEIKGVQPTWTTNPLTTIYGGYVYIE
jgi:hypothetical protein